MTEEFDMRNAEKSRAVCAAMAERADTGKRALTGRERRILEMWPRFEDGEPVMVGDLFRIPNKTNRNGHVAEVHLHSGGLELVEGCGFAYPFWCGERVKRPAPEVLDADGAPIKVGDTHREPDSWEKLVEDAAKGMFGYWKCFGTPCEECPSRIDGETPATYYGITSCLKAKQLDVIRRAKKLAGVE